MADFTGTSGDDLFTGVGDDDDDFNMSQGGKDTVSGGAGGDTFVFGAALTAADRIDGGADFDTVTIQGDYSAGLTLGAATLHGVERIQFLAGFDYRLTLADGNADPGTQLELSNNHGASSLWVDASAMVNGGAVFTFSDRPNTIIGSQSGDTFDELTTTFDLDGQGGDDVLVVFSDFAADSRFDGGDGYDTAGFLNGFTGVLRASQLRHVEALNLSADSDIAFTNGNVDAGATLRVANPGGSVGSRLDASAETTGHYWMAGSPGDDTLIGGRSADTLSGGFGDDQLTGGKGGEQLTGGDGGDSFIFTKAGDSLKKAPDFINDFNPAQDHIDLSQIDARTDKAGDQAFHLVSQFGHVSGELVFAYDAEVNGTRVQADVNGDGKADLVIDLSGHLTDTAGFVL